jgi:beta-alanine--pyruvate transaminase
VEGRTVLDGTSGLWCVNAGHCRPAIVEAIQRSAATLDFAPGFQMGHPSSFALARALAALAPGDLDHVFFANSGSEAVDSALKIALAYHQSRGEPERVRFVGRMRGYHGVGFGGISVGGIESNRKAFAAQLLPQIDHLPHTHDLAHNAFTRGQPAWGAHLAEALEEIVARRGAKTIAAVIVEPMAGSTGVLVPPRGYLEKLRAICDAHGILLVFDEVITGFGRLGAWFGSEKYDIQPDLITSAKGLSSAYASIGAVIASDHVFEPFLDAQSMYAHGITFGGHPVMCAIALKNIEIMKREKLVENVRDNGEAFRDTLAQLLDLDIVGDLRGTGYFYALELVKDKETRGGFSDEDSETLLRGFLSPRLFERGLICRADDRGDPVVQISPPLIATQAEFDEITGILGDVLTEAQEMIQGKAPALAGEVSREPGTRIP